MFYSDGRQEKAAFIAPSTPKEPSASLQNVDQSFIYKVWTWLGRHSDISIGQNRRHNETPLQQFWLQSDNAVSALQRSNQDVPRIFANDDRILQAILGNDRYSHGLFAPELTLLSHIAASGRGGILQADLSRAADQDIRSVPKRTNLLRDKGYIVKEAAHVNGRKTSRLRLRRYATDKQNLSLALDGSPRKKTTIRNLVDEIGGFFTSETRLELDDVAKLGEMRADAERKALTKVIRCMERAGCVKRVRMALAPDAGSGDLKTYVQLLRIPTDADEGVFDKSSLPFSRTVSDLVGVEAAKLTPQSPRSEGEASEQAIAWPQWNPDRPVANILPNSKRRAVSATNLDEFGFPIAGQGRSVFGDRGASLTELIRDVGASDVDMQMIETGQDEAEPEVPGTPEPTMKARTPKGKRRKVNHLASTPEKSQGRPRKFLRGTEKFWQYHFIRARRDADGSDGESQSKGGTMSHPAGIALFRNRPKEFDETVVEAIAAGLPLPATAEEISEDWIHGTKAVLDRYDKGAYATPAGIHLGRTRKMSQLLIVRSDRLKELHLKYEKVPRFRFISSSAAHSLARLYFSERLAHDSRVAVLSQVNITVQTPKKGDGQAAGKAGRLGPRLGVFVETATPQHEEAANPASSQLPPPLTAAEYQQVMDDTDADSDIDQHSMSRSTFTSRRTSRTSIATRTPSRGNAIQKSRTQSMNSQTDTVPSSHATPSRPSRQRRLTQKAADSLRTGTLDAGFWLSKRALQHAGTAFDHPTDYTRARAYSQPLEESAIVHSGAPGTDDVEVFDAPLILQDQPSSPTGQPLPANQAATAHQEALIESGISEDRAKEQPLSHIASVGPVSALPTSSVQRQKATSKLCRKIIVDLVTLASGAAPNDATTFCRVMIHRWHAEGGKGNPPSPLVNASLKRLSESSKLRLIVFSFRGKGGVQKKKSIFALHSIDPTGEQIQALKKKIADADPSDYVPLEWEAEKLLSLNVSDSGLERDGADQARMPQVQGASPVFSEQHAPSSELVMPLLSTSKTSRPRRQGGNSIESAKAPRRRKKSTHASRTNQKAIAFSKEVSSITNSFLTLKVPRLRELPQVHAFNASLQDPEWKRKLLSSSQDREERIRTPQHLSAVPIRFNPEVNSQRAAALPTPIDKRRSGLRKKNRGKHFDPVTHEIVSGRPQIHLPQTLNAIIDLEQADNPLLKISPEDDEKTRFFAECDIVKAWEIRCQNDIQPSDMKWSFINHSFPDQEESSSIKYWLLVNVSRDGIISEQPSFETQSWPPFVVALQEAITSEYTSPAASSQTDEISVPSTPRSVTKGLAGIRRKRQLSITPEYVPPTPASKRSRRNDIRPLRPKPLVRDHDGKFAPSTPSQEAVQKSRETQALKHLQKMSAEERHGLAVTVICVQILAGGVKGNVDWSVVASLLPSKHDETLLEDCWNLYLEDHASDVRSLAEEFQKKYIEALEVDRVPTVNFADLHSTNWKNIVGWALRALASASKDELRLPGTRSDFLRQHDLTLNDPPSTRKVYLPAKNTDKSAREDLYKSTIYGTRLQQAASPDQEEVSRLRSLMLSLIICPDDRYSQHLGGAKFYSIARTEKEAETLMQPVLAQLEKVEKLVCPHSNARYRKGPRQWRVSAKFYEQFGEKNCIITSAMLMDATRYKLAVLDDLFARGRTLGIGKGSRLAAGEMLAVMQLLGMGMIEIRPAADIPNSRYGVDWQRVGYNTNKLEKGQFGFGVVVGTKKGYVFGDVVGKRTAVDLPRGHITDPRQTPIWVDVDDEIVEEVWEMVVGSVIGMVSTRPGVSVEEISKSLGSAVGLWEVALMLSWAEKAGFVKKTRSGYGWETKEWWWLCLGSGPNEDDL